MSRLPVPWVVWNAQEGPLPDFSGPRVVLLEQDVFTPGAQAPPVLQGPQHTFILPTHFPNMLGKMLAPAAPPNLVPALFVERQADHLATDHLRDLVKIPATYRALVITPREHIALGLLGVLPKDWGVGYTPLWAFINLVIVRGPEGEDAWPLDLSWVRALRDECAFLAPHVAFTFLGWGRYLPERRKDKVRHMLDGREHFAVPWAQDDEPAARGGQGQK